MRILIHICCGPCATFSVDDLRRQGHQVEGFFYNPNIHPYTEYQMRLEAVKKFAEAVDLKMVYNDEYDLIGFLRSINFREEYGIRCRYCYEMRLRRTAIVAKNGKYDGFSSTLLVSPHQDHEMIKTVAETVSKEVGIPLHYQDFRKGYKHNYELSRKYGLYRQQYCGCIYSEYERHKEKSAEKKSRLEIN